ncbi:Hpt domain-containing protein [Chthonobacter rhizosphaerae]|uniref:Hpt domain-containing protein n=1 Tax=Chthonobacter rhizosphaerae TaxID=2735553 RepID=UPI0015EEA484|nr:Hpt domain-containing protein [Chthonobacter rhizosphaerae]
MAARKQALEVVEAKNDLRKKVREVKSRGAGDDPVSRAEAALKILSSNFETWMRDEIATVGRRYEAWGAAGHPDGEARDAFFRAVHDLKGQATTLGYPLVAHAAGSLCALLDRLPSRDDLPLALVDQHVQAIQAIFRESVRDEGDRIGSELVSLLNGLSAAYLAEHAPPEPSLD